MLDLVNPVGPRRRCFGETGQAGFDGGDGQTRAKQTHNSQDNPGRDGVESQRRPWGYACHSGPALFRPKASPYKEAAARARTHGITIYSDGPPQCALSAFSSGLRLWAVRTSRQLSRRRTLAVFESVHELLKLVFRHAKVAAFLTPARNSDLDLG